MGYNIKKQFKMKKITRSLTIVLMVLMGLGASSMVEGEGDVPNGNKKLVFYSQIQRHGARTPQAFFYRNNSYPGLTYGELTDQGYLQLWEKGSQLREYLISEGLISSGNEMEDKSYRFISSPTSRVQMSFYSFIQGFNPALNPQLADHNILKPKQLKAKSLLF